MKKNVSCLLRLLYSIISLFFLGEKANNGTNMPQPNFGCEHRSMDVVVSAHPKTAQPKTRFIL